jgi:hypothetical protein
MLAVLNQDVTIENDLGEQVTIETHSEVDVDLVNSLCHTSGICFEILPHEFTLIGTKLSEMSQ